MVCETGLACLLISGISSVTKTSTVQNVKWKFLRCFGNLIFVIYFEDLFETIIYGLVSDWNTGLNSKVIYGRNCCKCSSIKTDQLYVTCFIISLFTSQHVSDVNTSIFRSLRLICWVISWVVLFWYDVCWCYVVVWLGWCGIRMQAEVLLQPASGHHTTPAKPQRASACIQIPHHPSQTTT